MYKNLTIRQIAFYISLTVCIAQLLTLVGLFYHEINGVSFWKIFFLIIGSIALTYSVVVFLVEKYFFRRIKVIYKMISGSKDSLKDTDGISRASTFKSINEKVEEWTTKTNAELSSLKSMEIFRKRYLGDVSHELKTPLFTVQGYLYTLLEGGLYDDKINTKYIKSALRNVERLQDIVEDLEMIHELEANESETFFTTFDIKTLTDDVISDLKFKANEKRIAIDYKNGADTSFRAKGDKNQIRQVFINLISNSIKYGNEGGRTKISFYDLDKKVLIEISDNGIGIAEPDQKHIFNRFYRVDKSRSKEVEGSGLGLSIVKHILERHGQKISIRSTIKTGSTFGFTLDKA